MKLRKGDSTRYKPLLLGLGHATVPAVRPTTDSFKYHENSLHNECPEDPPGQHLCIVCLHSDGQSQIFKRLKFFIEARKAFPSVSSILLQGALCDGRHGVLQDLVRMLLADCPAPMHRVPSLTVPLGSSAAESPPSLGPVALA